jgi:hypothetical protein
MKTFLAWIRRTKRESADREVLSRLDARSLKDVGLESWNGALAQRLESYRQREVLRLAMKRIGAY